MKLRLGILLLIGALVASSATLAAQTQMKGEPKKKPGGAGYDFKTLAQKTWAAWETLDPAKPAPFYAKEADHVFFDITPLNREVSKRLGLAEPTIYKYLSKQRGLLAQESLRSRSKPGPRRIPRSGTDVRGHSQGHRRQISS